MNTSDENFPKPTPTPTPASNPSTGSASTNEQGTQSPPPTPAQTPTPVVDQSQQPSKIDIGRRLVIKEATNALLADLLNFVQQRKIARDINHYPGENARTDRSFGSYLLGAYDDQYNLRVLGLRDLIQKELGVPESDYVLNAAFRRPDSIASSQPVFEMIEKRIGWLALMESHL